MVGGMVINPAKITGAIDERRRITRQSLQKRLLALPVSELASRQQGWDQEKFPQPDYPLQEARWISLSWMMRGRTRTLIP